MFKNKYARNLCNITTALILAQNLNACINTTVKKQESAKQTEFNAVQNEGLISASDEDTAHNLELARKAKKIAEYVLNDPVSKKSVNWDGTTARIELVKIELNSGIEKAIGYQLNVLNINEQEFLGQSDVVDSMDIRVRVPVNDLTEKEYSEKIILFYDNGLDGIANSSFEGTITYSSGGEIPAGSIQIEKSFNFNKDSEEENQEYFQKKYEQTLDELLEFYEQRKEAVH